MMAVFDAVARGQAKFDEPLTITPQEKVSGSGILAAEFSDGVALPMRDVMHLMMALNRQHGDEHDSGAIHGRCGERVPR